MSQQSCRLQTQKRMDQKKRARKKVDNREEHAVESKSIRGVSEDLEMTTEHIRMWM
ncbi:Protein CBG26543 [Caenorhabditis briggsae]|uniref:Protein CBG26543 n=1 Tax=Caenorhabditis briggsae TaxID=6238 RepID=B6IIX4_CAEBR|nr:Protein CBG26543 [Caenorhabditis briggsae]CAR99854.1 Protein CBG26543 [Caenorhabditis briggsae]